MRFYQPRERKLVNDKLRRKLGVHLPLQIKYAKSSSFNAHIFFTLFWIAHYIACPSGWAKWNGNCYLLQPEVNAMVFQSAEDGCVNRGGHLASIESEAELGFIQSYIAGYHQCGNDWWSLDVQENKCYYYSPDKLSWFDAKSSCDESDSTLVVVDSAAKNNKMLGLGN